MKRFYKLVSTNKTATGFEVQLDGKPVKTPYKNALITPSENLANEIVKEWAQQGEIVVPDTMPLTQILSTKIDRIPLERAQMSAAILKYLDTDLVCYHAPEPPELVRAQSDAWAPVLKWAQDSLGAPLETTDAIAAIKQSDEIHAAVTQRVEGLNDDQFTLVQILTPLAGSIILALAFLDGEINAQELFDLTHIEENFKAGIYNEEKYGPDPAEEKKDKAMMVDLNAAQLYLESLA